MDVVEAKPQRRAAPGKAGALGGLVSDRAIEAAILEIVQDRGSASTACPSEVARALAPVGWRPLMQRVRAVAGTLAARGDVEITQGGSPVSAHGPWRGPIRLRLPRT